MSSTIVAQERPPTQASPLTPIERATSEALLAALEQCFSECYCLRHVSDALDREHAHKAYAYAHSALTIARALLDPLPIILAADMQADPLTERVLVGGAR